MTVTSAEELRAESAGLDILMLAAGDGDQAAQASLVLGLDPRAGPDGPGPSCDWCGRTQPTPGTLADESLNGPENWACTDADSCVATRKARLENWMTAQFPWWSINYQKYLASQRYAEELRARSLYGGGLYALSADPLDLLALDQVCAMVDSRASAMAPELAELTEVLALAAQGITDPATPEAPPEPVRFDPWSHTLQNPRHREHLLGHHRQQKGVTDAASAMARKAVSGRHTP